MKNIPSVLACGLLDKTPKILITLKYIRFNGKHGYCVLPLESWPTSEGGEFYCSTSIGSLNWWTVSSSLKSSYPKLLVARLLEAEDRVSLRRFRTKLLSMLQLASRMLILCFWCTSISFIFEETESKVLLLKWIPSSCLHMILLNSEMSLFSMLCTLTVQNIWGRAR